MVFGEFFTTPRLFRGPCLRSICPERMVGGQTQGQECQGSHVKAAVVSIPVGDMRLGTIESQCQKTFLVEVPVVTEHTVDDSCHGSTYLSVRQFLGQPSTPCQQSQWLEGTGAVGNGTPEYGEGPLGRDETFQNHAETLHALLGTLEIAIRRIPYLIFPLFVKTSRHSTYMGWSTKLL